MIFLLSCVVKASVILAAAFLIVRLLRRQSAALRHCVLATGILCAAITPALSLVMPSWNFQLRLPAVPEPPKPATDSGFVAFPLRVFQEASGMVVPATPTKRQPEPQPEPRHAPLWQSTAPEQVVLAVWLVGSLLMAAILLVGILRLFRLAAGARPLLSGCWSDVAFEIATDYGLSTPPRLLLSANPSLLVTWGWRRPTILLPIGSENWPEERIRAVLCHELAHVRRGDWVLQLTAEMLCSLYWFNPLLWVACRALRRESEQASDDAAINCGIAGSDYAEHLLAVVRSLRQPCGSWSYALSMAHPSTLERRFAAILNPALNRRTLTWLSMAVTLAAFLLLTFPVSMARGSAVRTPIPTTLRSLTAAVMAGPSPAVAEPEQTAAAAAGGGSEFGVVQGTIRRADITAALPEVQITLEGGPADPKSVQGLIQGVAGRGIVFNPKRIGTVDEVVRDVTDQAGAQGVGPGFPIFDDAVAAFRAANAARFVAESDDDGRFTLKDVPSGQYTVHVEREGYFDLRARSGNPVKLTVTGQQTITTSVSMTPGGVISGRVRDASGEPQQNVGVQIFATGFQNGFPTLRGTTQKLTDDHGAYRLFWLPPGDYYVAVNPGGSPNADATLRTLYPGTLDVARATPVSVRAGETVSGIDIQLPTIALPKISGKVTSTIPAEETAQMASVLSAALGRPTLMLMGRDPNKPDIGAGTARTIGTVTLNGGTGTFEVTGISPGSYDLYARIPELNSGGGAGFAFAKVPIDVRNENISGISITVNKSVIVTGRLTIDGKAPGSTPIRIQLQPDGSGAKLGVYQSVGQRVVSPEEDGAFSIVQVPPGPYRLVTGAGLPNDLYLADVRQGGASVFDPGVDITSEKPGALQVIMSSGAGTVEGTAFDADGKPLAGAFIVLAPPMARRQNRALFHTATADANGKFSIHSVAPGGYQLFAWQQNIPAGAYFNAGFLAQYEGRSRFVNVAGKSVASEQISAVPMQ